MSYYKENQLSLDNEIARVLEALENAKPGTDEYQAMAKSLSTLNDMRQKQQEIDNSAKKNRADIIIGASGLGVTLLTAVGYIARDWSMFVEGIKFEETGAVQGLMTRNCWQRIFKK